MEYHLFEYFPNLPCVHIELYRNRGSNHHVHLRCVPAKNIVGLEYRQLKMTSWFCRPRDKIGRDQWAAITDIEAYGQFVLLTG